MGLSGRIIAANSCIYPLRCRFFLTYVVYCPMSLIEEFTESEKQRLNWLQKLSAHYPDVTETSLLALRFPEPEIKPDRIIRPSIDRRAHV